MTGADKPFLWNGQWRPRGNRELLFDEIDAGDHLGDGMFDLEPRVHFKKIEGAAAIDELDRARAAIVARPGDARCRLAEALTPRSEERRVGEEGGSTCKSR